MRECHQKIKFKNMSMLQFLNFIGKPIHFKIKGIDLSEGTINYEYVVGVKNRLNMSKGNYIKSEITSNDKNEYKVSGFILEMLNTILSDNKNEQVLNENDYYTEQFIEETLICSEFLYFDGFLEAVRQ